MQFLVDVPLCKVRLACPFDIGIVEFHIYVGAQRFAFAVAYVTGVEF